MTLCKKDVDAMRAIAKVKLLPLRASMKRISDARLFGRCRFRQRISRITLQSRLPTISGHLADVVINIFRMGNDWVCDPILARTPKFSATLNSAQLEQHRNTWFQYGQLTRQTYSRCLHNIKLQLIQGHRSLPLFLMLVDQESRTGHTLSVIVHYNSEGTKIVAIDWLNTWNKYEERVNEVAMTLLSTLLCIISRQKSMPFLEAMTFGDIMALIRLPLSAPYDLQEKEVRGYCQSWDSYMVFKILAQGLEAQKLFCHLNRLSPQRRQEKVVHFTNSVYRAFEKINMA